MHFGHVAIEMQASLTQASFTNRGAHRHACVDSASRSVAKRCDGTQRSGNFRRHGRCSISDRSQAGPAMEPLSLSVHEGFDRLQRRIVAMGLGDTISPIDAADETGLPVAVCRAVFTGLERAGLMTADHDDRFTRSTLDLAK